MPSLPICGCCRATCDDCNPYRFKNARAFVMPFGKHKGRALDKIAETDDGLRYLAWAVDNLQLYGDVKIFLNSYLADPSIKKEIATALEKRKATA